MNDTLHPIDGEFCLDCDEPDPEDCATFAGSTLKR